MLNLRNFEKLCTRLWIKPRDEEKNEAGKVRVRTGPMSPFIFNTSQKVIMKKLYERQAKNLPFWLIFLKARRLGISTFSSALLDAHCCQKTAAAAMIVAQLTQVGKAMFEQCKDFGDCLPFRLPPGTQHELFFPHSGYVSTLRRTTAKTVIGGRGLTLTALHMTEAAFYPGEASFVALLNTVSSADRDNIVIIETTANGMEGDGQAYYNYWNDAVAGKNDFMPIFLPWYNDPSTLLPDKYAEDAPADEYEKWLMKDFKVTKGQIAWHRITMSTKCGGSRYKWQEEYPADPSEAFLSSGNPAFDREEISAAMRSVSEPIARMKMTPTNIDPKSGLGEVGWADSTKGELKVWEWPREGDHYFCGVDAAKGVVDGDFACAVGWNAETGKQAFSYSAKVGPEILGAIVNNLGRMYNRAMLNIELTGGWGWACLKELRDAWHYPSQYLWMSKDDRPDRKPRHSLGWETTMNSRKRLLIVFRTALRRNEVFPCDIELVQQMSNIQMEMSWNWTIEKGHDDNIFAAMLGFIAMQDHHFPHGRGDGRVGQTFVTQEKNESVTWIDSPETTAAGALGWSSTEHLNKLKIHQAQQKRKLLLLDGI